MRTAMKKTAVTVAVLTSLVLALGPASPADAWTFNCTGGVMCGYANTGFSGTRLFNPSNIIFGAEYDFTDDILSSVNNDTSGARICLMEQDVIDWPWIGVPAGVAWGNLGEQSVNNVADYVKVWPNTDSCPTG